MDETGLSGVGRKSVQAQSQHVDIYSVRSCAAVSSQRVVSDRGGEG